MYCYTSVTMQAETGACTERVENPLGMANTLRAPLWTFLVFMLDLFFMSTAATAGGLPGPLVDSQWLNSHLKDSNLVIIDVRGDAQNFAKKGHIPGARLWDWKGKDSVIDLTGRVKNMPTANEINRAMRQLGVNDTSLIVFTTNASDIGEFTYGTMAFWTLKYFGHTQVAVLDGGTSQWADQGLPLSHTAPVYRTGDFTAGDPVKDLIVGTEEMKHIVEGRHASIVDFRPRPYFTGEKMKSFMKKPGHIPGAVNIPGDQLFETHHGTNDDFPIYLTYKSTDMLKDLFAKNGIDLSHPSIAYCETGHLSSGGFYAVRELLHDKRMRWYHQSLKAWEEAGLPVELSVPK